MTTVVWCGHQTKPCRTLLNQLTQVPAQHLARVTHCFKLHQQLSKLSGTVFRTQSLC